MVATTAIIDVMAPTAQPTKIAVPMLGGSRSWLDSEISSTITQRLSPRNRKVQTVGRYRGREDVMMVASNKEQRR